MKHTLAAQRGSAVIIAATGALLAACGGSVTDGPSVGERLIVGEVTVLVSEPPSAGMDALGGGTVEVVGDCLGADGTVMIWPHGTEVVQESPLMIEIPEVGTVGLGDVVELGGGMIYEPSSDPTGPDPDPPGVPQGCASYPVFLAH